MNTQDTNNAGDESGAAAKPSLAKKMIWVVVGIVIAGAGFSAPLLFVENNEASEVVEPAVPKLPIPDPTDEIGFVDFDEQIININDPRFSRYLKLSFSLQVSKSQVDSVSTLVEERNALLVNWLIGHIADKEIGELKGKQGANRLRREIHDAFNQLLFTDGIERIQDVLYKEFNVQ